MMPVARREITAGHLRLLTPPQGTDRPPRFPRLHAAWATLRAERASLLVSILLVALTASLLWIVEDARWHARRRNPPAPPSAWIARDLGLVADLPAGVEEATLPDEP